METIAAGQCWTYRCPQSFEHSRLVVGAAVKLNDKTNVICCSVLRVPYRPHVAPEPSFTIPFLPMTEEAFRESAVWLVDDVEPKNFYDSLHVWRSNRRSMTAFTKPFSGLLDQFVEIHSDGETIIRGTPKDNSGPLLKKIATLLENGLVTETEPFPRDHREFEDILGTLRKLEPRDVEGRLVVGGFVNHPYGPGQQRCQECIYFLPNNLWCDLPELAVPVEPNWWCRLWRI